MASSVRAGPEGRQILAGGETTGTPPKLRGAPEGRWNQTATLRRPIRGYGDPDDLTGGLRHRLISFNPFGIKGQPRNP
jgi:hypothetical protein